MIFQLNPERGRLAYGKHVLSDQGALDSHRLIVGAYQFHNRLDMADRSRCAVLNVAGYGHKA
jgi:hypothetical protein